MRKFDKNDYNLVKDFEPKFRSAIDSKFVSGMTEEIKSAVSLIYKEVCGRQANLTCSGCVLQMMTTVGKLYFAYKEDTIKPKKKNECKNTVQTKSEKTA